MATGGTICITPRIPLILASGSAIRCSMLAGVGLQFEVMPADINEAVLRDSIQHELIPRQAEKLAEAKALAISALQPDAMVIGSDQICAFGDEILCKPGGFEAASAQLQKLSGQTHHQYSAVSLCQGGRTLWCYVDQAVLTMRALSEADITTYLHLDEPYSSCGAYKFESMGSHLFSQVEGNSYTIQGMPLIPLLHALREQGVYALEDVAKAEQAA